MPAITLNPGFVCLLASLIVLAAPRVARAPIMALSAVAALWLMLDRGVGAFRWRFDQFCRRIGAGGFGFGLAGVFVAGAALSEKRRALADLAGA